MGITTSANQKLTSKLTSCIKSFRDLLSPELVDVLFGRQYLNYVSLEIKDVKNVYSSSKSPVNKFYRLL